MSTTLLEETEVAGPGTKPELPADQVRALAELEQIMGFHISLAELAIKAHFQKNFAHLGLTQKQIAVLWLVNSCPGIIQVDIARMLRVQRATDRRRGDDPHRAGPAAPRRAGQRGCAARPAGTD